MAWTFNAVTALALAIILLRASGAFAQAVHAPGANGMSLSPAVAAQGVVTALAVGLVAGAVPAWNGSRLNVVEALRRLF